MGKFECYESKNDETLQKDFENIAEKCRELDKLKHSTILISGATGYIGSYLIKALSYYNRTNKANIKIIGIARDKEKVDGIFGDLLKNSYIDIIYEDVRNYINVIDSVDYIIHCASITKSKEFIKYPVETIETTVYGTQNLLELASKCKVKGFVYISTMEVYGVMGYSNKSVNENDLGYIDILNIRSSYPESKRMAENLCVAYMKEYGVKVKIARIAQTFGPGILQNENRVFAQFAKSVINRKDIILHTEGKSIGNYCYIRDVVKAIILILIKGKNGEVYNVSNESSTMSIREMAELISDKIAHNKIKVKVNIKDSQTNYGYPPDTNVKLDSSKIIKLGWKAEVSLEESYINMIKSMIDRNIK